MFWGGIRFNGRTQLIHIPGTMTGAYYLQNIINAIVPPLRNEIGDQFIFMGDNTRPHRTRAVQQALENGNNARLEWPAMSPDMNPITLQKGGKSLLLRVQRNGTIFHRK
nr:unnamed protein product [Callosobruchus chinensis]